VPSPLSLPTRRLTTAALLLAAGLMVLLQGCGGAANTERNKAQIRLVNATHASTGYPLLALRLDDQQRQGQAAYGQNAVYAEVDDGSPSLTITTQASGTALLTATPTLSKGRYYTSLALGAAGALRQVLLDDNQGEPDTNRALLRVVNASPDSGALDVYLTGAAEELSAAVPVQSGAVYGAVGGWVTVASASWRLRVTAANSKTDVRLDVSNLTLSNRQVGTLVLTPGEGGVLTNALHLVQRGAITRLDNTQARVRVVAGLDGAGPVTVAVAGAGAPLLQAAPSPAVSLYSLISAVNPVVTATQGGVALPLGGPAISAGVDRTLLLSGSASGANQAAGASTPQGVWLIDENRAPRDASQARVRLVNGLAEAGVAVALSADFQPLAGALLAPSASPYTETAAGTNVVLRVTREGSSTPLFVSAEQALVAGGTYSVFILGSVNNAPVGIVRRDR
jgi:hypothetical protein